MNIDGERCGKCDGGHKTEECSNYPLPTENHPDAFINKGKQPKEISDVTLPGTTTVIRHKGDGSCLFHAIAHILQKTKLVKTTGEQLRMETASFIDCNEHLEMCGKSIRQWISDLRDCDTSYTYAQQLRQGLWGGLLEIQVIAHIYEVQFMVFQRDSTIFKCIMTTEPERHDK